MNSKDDDDFYEILGGGRVHDAEPKTAKLAGALRGALQARQERQHLPPLRPPPIPITRKPPYWVPLWMSATATVAVASFFVGTMLPASDFDNSAQLPEGREKSLSTDIVQITSRDPQNDAENIQKILQAIGIEDAKAQEEKNLLVLEFQSPINNNKIVIEIAPKPNETRELPPK